MARFRFPSCLHEPVRNDQRTALPFKPRQSIIYVPLQVNRFHISILLIVQYKYLKPPRVTKARLTLTTSSSLEEAFWNNLMCDHEMEIGRPRSKSLDVLVTSLKTLAHSTAQSSYEEGNQDKALKV